MPEFELTDSILTSLNAQEPWPDNVKLFQPYEVEQILLPDNASCLAVQAFLKMCNLPFEVEMRWNAEFMSPSGRVPFIKCGAFVVSELEPIVQFAANKGVSLCEKLSSEEKAEMRAYMSLITNVLVNAELYISWIDDSTYNAVTKVRNSSVYPWPLGWLQTRAKRAAVGKRLKALNWGDKTLDQVLADVEQCCNSLSQRLGERDYFFGTTPSPLDALVFGHLRALLSANGPNAALFIKPLTTSLLRHVVRMCDAADMKLTPQEEYLISQAFSFTRTRLSAERTASERNTRIKRSRLCVRATSKETITSVKPGKETGFNKEIIGFKPFATKQLTITTAKDGSVTCKYDEQKNSPTLNIKQNESYSITNEIIEDVIDKVVDISFVNIKYEDKNDFEIVYPQDEKFANVTLKTNEYLGTIEENDINETVISLDMTEDIVHVLNDDEDEHVFDDGHVIDHSIHVINYDNHVIEQADEMADDHVIDVVLTDDDPDVIHDRGTGDASVINSDVLGSDALVDDRLFKENNLNDKDVFFLSIDSDVDSSKNRTVKEDYLTMSSSGLSKSLDKTDIPISSDSKSTLKFPSDEEISVECLLKYLRENNATYGHNFGNYLVVADID